MIMICGSSVVLLVLCGLQWTASASENDWDVLLFTQHWPVTVCMQWKEKAEGNTCTLPTDKNFWTVHGTWPSKIGEKEGPSFCNNSMKFNKDLLQPIEGSLEKYWMNIEANTNLYSLWKHEWQKHGTCAAELPKLNTEFSYFNQGLQWGIQYNMGSTLFKREIVPRQGAYQVEDIYHSITSSLGCRPMLQCVVDRATKYSLISEIRICFDKTLKLIDCDVLKPNHPGILTNCDLSKPIMYYDKITPNTNRFSPTYYLNYKKWLSIYEVITTLIKFTL